MLLEHRLDRHSLEGWLQSIGLECRLEHPYRSQVLLGPNAQVPLHIQTQQSMSATLSAACAYLVVDNSMTPRMLCDVNGGNRCRLQAERGCRLVLNSCNGIFSHSGDAVQCLWRNRDLILPSLVGSSHA